MNILGDQTESESHLLNIEATNRTNSITPRNLVLPACFDIKFIITYSKFHKCFSIRIFSGNIKINRWCIAVFKNIIKFKLLWIAKGMFPVTLIAELLYFTSLGIISLVSCMQFN